MVHLEDVLRMLRDEGKVYFDMALVTELVEVSEQYEDNFDIMLKTHILEDSAVYISALEEEKRLDRRSREIKKELGILSKDPCRCRNIRERRGIHSDFTKCEYCNNESKEKYKGDIWDRLLG